MSRALPLEGCVGEVGLRVNISRYGDFRGLQKRSGERFNLDVFYKIRLLSFKKSTDWR